MHIKKFLKWFSLVIFVGGMLSACGHTSIQVGFSENNISRQWTAHYTTAAAPLIPFDWLKWDLWQYSSKGPGHVLGAEEEYIDLNYMQPDFWQRFVGQDSNPAGNMVSVFLDIEDQAYEGELEKIV